MANDLAEAIQNSVVSFDASVDLAMLKLDSCFDYVEWVPLVSFSASVLFIIIISLSQYNEQKKR